MEQINSLKPMNIQETENAIIARSAASQGMVLLENKNQALPIKTKIIALFGGGAYATIKGGTGSGNVSNSYEISVYQGFVNAGYTITSAGWLDVFGAEYDRIQREDTSLSMIEKFWSGLKADVPDPSLTKEDIASASAADTAIYVISRNTGENFDRTATNGDYYLSDIEKENIQMIADNFKTSIVVLNTCVMDTKFFDEIKGLDAMLVMSQAGMEGGAALVEVLNGKVTPSGKLTDTWAVNYEDNAASKTFSNNDGNTMQENYEEGIYVGYRYFDSFNITPKYEFGYGSSYTHFDIEVKDAAIDGENLTIKVNVTNAGKMYSGKEVIQVYYSAPKGELDKPYQELIGFGKTSELAPMENQIMSISFPIREMSSYSEKLAAHILEAGDYLIRVGNSSRNTKVIAVVRLDQTKITEQLSNQLQLDQNFKDLTSKDTVSFCYIDEAKQIASAPLLILYASSLVTLNNASKYDGTSITTYLPEGSDYQSSYTQGSKLAINDYKEKIKYIRACSNAKLYDVYTGKITMEEFVAQMDVETLATLANGIDSGSNYMVEVEQPIEGAKPSLGKASGSTTSNFVNSYGIPNSTLADGPAGLHVPPMVSQEEVMSVNFFATPEKMDELKEIPPMPQFHNNCTAFPVGMLLAQTWDTELIRMVGEAYGREMLEKYVSVALAPGMNIHRDPLCGRNFEYYSEDPLITGMAGSMFTLGVQSLPGIGVSIKHFAANNQEINRICNNSSVSERALREIYLKGFEMAVKSAQPMTVMTSYNKINGIHTSNRYDLCTHVLRGEWGFDGYVMTDWGSQSNKAQDMHAGNDMIMGGSSISKMVNAVKAPAPLFEEDGSINVTTIVLHGGFSTEKIENWNSFLVHAEGKDYCSTIVAADIEVGEKVQTMVEEKKASIIVQGDNTKLVKYFGTNIGAYLTKGDLQKSVMNFLKVLMKTWNIKDVYNEKTGYEPITVPAYSMQFDNLETYLTVEKTGMNQ